MEGQRRNRGAKLGRNMRVKAIENRVAWLQNFFEVVRRIDGFGIGNALVEEANEFAALSLLSGREIKYG